jgi:hypothetical protein
MIRCWQVEAALAQLKTIRQMEVLHGKTVPGMLKALRVFAIVYNLVRIVMCQSARLQHMGVERISFADALRWLSAPSTGMPLGALIVKPVPMGESCFGGCAVTPWTSRTPERWSAIAA